MTTATTPPVSSSHPGSRLARAALEKRFGAKFAKDIARGVDFGSRVWDWKGSDAAAFVEFCEKHYHPPGKARSGLLRRLDEIHHLVSGSFNVIAKTTRAGLDMAEVELTASEELFGAFSPGTHLDEDLRTFNVAALAQLNFGTDDLDPPTTREGWAARRVSKIGRTVIPADLLAEASKRQAEVDRFVSGFNLHLDKIDYTDSSVKFPKDTVRISHWGLRDYMTSLNGQENALPRQRAIRDLMRRVVDGEIPREIVDNPKLRWRQADNTVTGNGAPHAAAMTGPLRWEQFKKAYDVQRRIDPHTQFGNIIDNKFKAEREIPEEKIVRILEDVLSAPVAEQVARFVEKRLGRALEPHDVYFRSFQAGTKKSPLGFDISKRYPDAAALTRAIPGILVKLGFKKDRAEWIGARIQVDNSRSAGHAWGPATSQDIARLRVRVEKGGINEEEFGTFMHELGHCTEQVLTSYGMDYKSLWGVPNTAFTEGFAFTFQDKADFILGRKAALDADITMLQRFWEVFEITGPALTEIRFFHWLYETPGASAADMHAAIRRIGDEVWTQYYARIFGNEGHGLMSVYSHMLWCSFYIADYSMGYVIAYQVRKFLATRKFAPEMERLCALGCIYPEPWMKAAVGQSISAVPLLEDVGRACKRVLRG
ncbi:MAG: hypothetical protein K8T20_07680 [Planctomycetes bacterium]|nr:hypothetical protein [Planctomycetota bacterium]